MRESERMVSGWKAQVQGLSLDRGRFRGRHTTLREEPPFLQQAIRVLAIENPASWTALHWVGHCYDHEHGSPILLSVELIIDHSPLRFPKTTKAR